LQDQEDCISECEEYEYLGVKIHKEGRRENGVKNRINKGRPMGRVSSQIGGR
jgi:hypothetical protein